MCPFSFDCSHRQRRTCDVHSSINDTHKQQSHRRHTEAHTHTYHSVLYIYIVDCLALDIPPAHLCCCPLPLPPLQLGTFTSTSPIVYRSPHDHNVRPSLSVDIEGIHPHAHRETQPFSKLLRSMWISDSESEGGSSSQAEHLFEDAAFEAVVNSPPRAEPSEPLAAVGGLAEGARPAGSNSALAAEVPTGVEPESGCAAPAAGAAPAVDRSAAVAAADGAEIHARRRPRVAERFRPSRSKAMAGSRLTPTTAVSMPTVLAWAHRACGITGQTPCLNAGCTAP
jgi:hypothetical protein